MTRDVITPHLTLTVSMGCPTNRIATPPTPPDMKLFRNDGSLYLTLPSPITSCLRAELRVERKPIRYLSAVIGSALCVVTPLDS